MHIGAGGRQGSDMKWSPLGSGGQRSGSHRVRDGFGSLMEESFSTPESSGFSLSQVAFLVNVKSTYFVSFIQFLWV